MHFQVVYSENQVSDPKGLALEGIVSPSPQKPRHVAAELLRQYPDIRFVEPQPLSRDDFYRCHDQNYVDGIFEKKINNGFGTKSDSLNASLPYTNGAMFTACHIATPTRPACALVSGFHHAGFKGETPGHFCTFNGLAIAAVKMIQEMGLERVAILDCDMHYGNGTEDILGKMRHHRIFHESLGLYYKRSEHAGNYLRSLHHTDGRIARAIRNYRPQLIIYQSGADVHVNDPFGGVLTESEMLERDFQVFKLARDLGVPLAWCLAGGYQVDPDGGIGTVVRLHLNTFTACNVAYSG